MSNTALEVVDAYAVERTDRTGFDLYVVMDGPTGIYTVTVTPICLLRYTAFQEHILDALGLMYRCRQCEGRSDEAANERWREFCAGIRPIPAPSTAPLN